MLNVSKLLTKKSITQNSFWKLDDQAPIPHFVLGMSYFGLDQYENGIPEYEKALKIYKKLGITAFLDWCLFSSWLGISSNRTI